MCPSPQLAQSHLEPQGPSDPVYVPSPSLLAFFLHNWKSIITNAEHSHSTLYLRNVLHSLIEVISENNFPRYVPIIILRWYMKKQSHVEGLGHRAGTSLILSLGSYCFHLIYSALLSWIASICPSRCTLLCQRRLTYINDSHPSVLHLNLAIAEH